MLASGSIADISARGRDDFEFWQGSELRLTWGWAPIDQVSMNGVFGNSYHGRDYYSTFISSYLYSSRYYGGNGYLSGAVNLGYTYRFKKWFELSGILTYSGYYRNYYDKFTDRLAFRHNEHSVSVMPYVRFVWLHREWVRLYSGLGLGVSLLCESGEYGMDVSLYPAFSVTPIGITVGTYIYGLAELSIGTTGCISVGLGYKF